MCNSLRNTNAAVEDEQMDRERERKREEESKVRFHKVLTITIYYRFS